MPPTRTFLKSPLTERQTEILHLVSLGYGEKQIAGRLHVHVGTVKSHLAKVYQKLGAVDSAHAVLIACFAGILGPTAVDAKYIASFHGTRAHGSERVYI
jgi:DNA-binding NarL/FixJ family response regulator